MRGIINEPTAAALAYGLHDKNEENQFLVFDLGGGTYDVSILEMFEGIMEVRASGGDNFLGGEDFVETLVKDFLHQHELRGLDNKKRNQLYKDAEKAKITLSTEESTMISLIIDGETYETKLNRDQFEEKNNHLLDRLRKPILVALRDASIKASELDRVVLVGGATKMPIIKDMVARMFGKLPTCTINPDEVVGMGCSNTGWT